MTYSEFFHAVTGFFPLPFQERFHESAAAFTMLRAPTGLGKTETVLVDWLWRLKHQRDHTPRRLIWVLPGRALTQQVAKVVRAVLEKAAMGHIRVYELLGGSADNDATLGPDEPAVLVGTQDILLSRALNRGYARRPFRWPIDFGLLNNDAYWVLDEVQLLGDGLATATQLAAFQERFGGFGPFGFCWMSATFRREWLDTVDFAPLCDSVAMIELDERDFENEVVRKRIHAAKRLQRSPDTCATPAGAAEFVVARHQAGTLSLVVVNTVVRARDVYAAITRLADAECLLLHSRFRAGDRTEHMQKLEGLQERGGIVVATQVIEAGINISAAAMLTDVAPYSSLVQRFGRVNRKGDDGNCEIDWVDLRVVGKKGWAAPYEEGEIANAMEALTRISSAAPADLPPITEPARRDFVLRRSDLLDLFDTTPDLAGNEIDISRFVRSGEDRDVYVAWRDWPGEKPEELNDVGDEELCPAPIGELREFWKKHTIWIWDTLAGKWSHPKTLVPGRTYLVHVREGGYTRDAGWSQDSKARVDSLEGENGEPEADDADPRSYLTYEQTLQDHTADVCREMEKLLNALANIDFGLYRDALAASARKHDWGKAHPVMQYTLHNGPGPYAELLAKQERGRAAKKHSRPFFRHELASAMAMLADGDSDLAAYLAAAHHGRIRVSIRSMVREREAGREFTRGICRDGDQLLECELGGGAARPEVIIKLSAMEMGRASTGDLAWTERVLRLRDKLGPFRLAYLEMLLRTADERASDEAGKRLARKDAQ